MTPGDAFYLNVLDSHRYFVLHVQQNPIERVIVLNFTSYHPGKCDETCIVTPAEYNGLDHTSVISYRHGMLLEGDELKNFAPNIGRKLPSVANSILKKIRDGALTSPYTPRKIKKELAALP